VLYRRPHGTDWERLDLAAALEMVADRAIATRRATWTWDDAQGDGQDPVRVRRTLGIASLGGATLDNKENYLIKKLLTALGVVRWRTRPGCATARRRPGSVPRSAVAAGRPSCRTCRTPTAS
jgi:hypothetical protein